MTFWTIKSHKVVDFITKISYNINVARSFYFNLDRQLRKASNETGTFIYSSRYK